jgi:hypothetical protein
MALQSCESPNFGNFELPSWEFGTKWHFGACLVAKHKEYYKGEGDDFLQVWATVSLTSNYEYVFARGSFVHQKCSNYALTNLLFSLCKIVWIIDSLIIFPNPYPRAPSHPFTFKMLRAREHIPTPYPFDVFTLDSQLSLSRSLGMCQ